jgi:carbon-monoxide dehydrogenase medium subunit
MFIRRVPKFDYHAPTSLQEALDLLAKYGEKAEVLAGGTDVIVAMKRREKAPENLVNLKGIGGLQKIESHGKDGLKIGGLTTLGELERSTVIKEKLPILRDALTVMAAPQVRNLATIGGNLCSAVPSADTAPPLIALGASVKLVGARGERTVLVEDFFVGPGESVLETDEILTEVLIPEQEVHSQGAYFKLMRRNALDLALVGVAACLTLDGGNGVCQGARIALGAVAPTPIRAPKAEKSLLNKEIDEEKAGEAGRVASQEASPIADIRASKEYRIEMIKVLTRKAILKARERIRAGLH